jgi:hypothetical protein
MSGFIEVSANVVTGHRIAERGESLDARGCREAEHLAEEPGFLVEYMNSWVLNSSSRRLATLSGAAPLTITVSDTIRSSARLQRAALRLPADRQLAPSSRLRDNLAACDAS